MTIFGQSMGVLIGFVLVIQAGGHLDRMTRHTNHFIRIGYYLLTVGGAALIMGPFAESEPWLIELGWLLLGIGACIFMVFGRRDKGVERSDKPS